MSLAMDDPTDLKQEVMVSQSYQSISQSSNHFLMSMLELKSLQYLRLKAVRANLQTKFCFHSKRFFSSFKRKTSQRKSQNHEPGFGAKDWLAYTSTFTMVCLWLVSVSLGHFGYRLVKDMKPIYHLQKHIT